MVIFAIGGPNFTVGKERISTGSHKLTVTISAEDDQVLTNSLGFQGNNCENNNNT